MIIIHFSFFRFLYVYLQHRLPLMSSLFFFVVICLPKQQPVADKDTTSCSNKSTHRHSGRSGLRTSKGSWILSTIHNVLSLMIVCLWAGIMRGGDTWNIFLSALPTSLSGCSMFVDKEVRRERLPPSEILSRKIWITFLLTCGSTHARNGSKTKFKWMLVFANGSTN